MEEPILLIVVRIIHSENTLQVRRLYRSFQIQFDRLPNGMHNWFCYLLSGIIHYFNYTCFVLLQELLYTSMHIQWTYQSCIWQPVKCVFIVYPVDISIVHLTACQMCVHIMSVEKNPTDPKNFGPCTYVLFGVWHQREEIDWDVVEDNDKCRAALNYEII